MSGRDGSMRLTAGAPVALLAWIAVILAAAAMAVGIYALRATEGPQWMPAVVTTAPLTPTPWVGIDRDGLKEAGFTGPLGGVTP